MSEEKNGNGRARAIRTIEELLKTGGFTEAEVEARGAKAQELLLKYNLSMSDIGNGKGEPVIGDNDFLTDRTTWVGGLLGEVARLFLCGHFHEEFPAEVLKRRPDWREKLHTLYGGGHAHFVYRHNFIGKQVDIAVAKAFGDYLLNAMQAICKVEQKSVSAKDRSRFQNAFMYACAARLASRLKAKRLEAATTGNVGGTNLPAVISLYEQAQQAYEGWKELNNVQVGTKLQKSRISHAGGFNAGLAAGNRIGLDQQVEGKPSGQKRLPRK